MKTQFKFVTKEEAHKMIDNVPGNNVLILTYDKRIGCSNVNAPQRVQPKCNFVLYVGNKKLVKRKEFEQYISKILEV